MRPNSVLKSQSVKRLRQEHKRARDHMSSECLNEALRSDMCIVRDHTTCCPNWDTFKS